MFYSCCLVLRSFSSRRPTTTTTTTTGKTISQGFLVYSIKKVINKTNVNCKVVIKENLPRLFSSEFSPIGTLATISDKDNKMMNKDNFMIAITFNQFFFFFESKKFFFGCF